MIKVQKSNCLVKWSIFDWLWWKLLLFFTFLMLIISNTQVLHLSVHRPLRSCSLVHSDLLVRFVERCIYIVFSQILWTNCLILLAPCDVIVVPYVTSWKFVCCKSLYLSSTERSQSAVQEIDGIWWTYVSWDEFHL